MTREASATRFSLLAVTMHWLTFALLVFIYLSGELHDSFARDNALREFTDNSHTTLGLILFLLVVLRWYVMRRSVAPPIKPEPPKWQLAFSALVKKLLYVFLFAAPLSGWIFLSADGALITIGAFPVPSVAPESRELAELSNSLHFLISTAGYAIIFVHVIGALYQHYLGKNDTLRRMQPRIFNRGG